MIDDSTDRVQCLGLPVDITANVDGFEVLTPDPSDPDIGFPNRTTNSLSYAVYRLFVSSSGQPPHWRGSEFFESSRWDAPQTGHLATLEVPCLAPDSPATTINDDRHYVVWKRFSDFDVLQRYLVRRYPDIPELPPKSFGRNLGQRIWDI